MWHNEVRKQTVLWHSPARYLLFYHGLAKNIITYLHLVAKICVLSFHSFTLPEKVVCVPAHVWPSEIVHRESGQAQQTSPAAPHFFASRILPTSGIIVRSQAQLTYIEAFQTSLLLVLLHILDHLGKKLDMENGILPFKRRLRMYLSKIVETLTTISSANIFIL